ncbi:hypothetical protein C5472_10045 [Photorhabdus sp. RW14-46]|nr:hypothetical protein PluDJC_21125 [Photorhabdus laumondii subsp. laumondii]NHB61459.1 hypothetical protein [Photorhabdus sp. RW14-46]RAW84381.1 hypothetical protein CKY12_12615 [Photorhabdus sp. S12-55]RAW89343.1 hypothetical protein CKY09_00170 [Photorhabdus sp. S5P8-50]
MPTLFHQQIPVYGYQTLKAVADEAVQQYIPVILQVASLLAALAHPGHIVTYAPGDSLPCRRDAS